jgi:hypothetical protein
MLRRQKRKRLRSHAHSEKTQKRPATATAHLDELLDEALKATFPASHPIAIDVELELRERGIATTPGFALPSEARRR